MKSYTAKYCATVQAQQFYPSLHPWPPNVERIGGSLPGEDESDKDTWCQCNGERIRVGDWVVQKGAMVMVMSPKWFDALFGEGGEDA